MSSPSTPDRLIPSAEELTEVVQAVSRVVATFTDENSRTARRGGQPDFEFWDQVLSGATTLGRLHNALHQPSLCHSFSDTSGWPISVVTSLVWLRALLDEMPARGTIDLQTKEEMSAAAARIEEAVEHVHANDTARRDADTSGESADGSSDCVGKVVSAADKARSALTILHQATGSMADALFDYKNDELASVSPVYAAIEQWYEAKDAASQQILRAAHRIDDRMAEGPQPSTVLLNELDQLGRECEILQKNAAMPTYLWAPGPDRMRDLLMVYGIGYFKGLVDQVITMRGQWDKLTGLLDRSGERAALPARNARRMSRDEDGGRPPGQQVQAQTPEGQWSKPMPKKVLMSRLDLKPRAFATFAKQHGLKQINRQQWQIRLDKMDAQTRRHIETGW